MKHLRVHFMLVKYPRKCFIGLAPGVCSSLVFWPKMEGVSYPRENTVYQILTRSTCPSFHKSGKSVASLSARSSTNKTGSGMASPWAGSWLGNRFDNLFADADGIRPVWAVKNGFGSVQDLALWTRDFYRTTDLSWRLVESTKNTKGRLTTSSLCQLTLLPTNGTCSAKKTCWRNITPLKWHEMTLFKSKWCILAPKILSTFSLYFWREMTRFCVEWSHLATCSSRHSSIILSRRLYSIWRHSQAGSPADWSWKRRQGLISVDFYL